MSLPPIAPPGWYPAGAGWPVMNRLSLSEMFARTFALSRRGFPALLALGAVPAALGAATGFVLISVYATGFLTGLVSLNPAGLADPMLACAAAGLVIMLVTAQSGGMIAQVSSQLMQGLRPDLRSAWRETTTIVPRLLLPYLVLCAAVWLACAGGLTVLLNTLKSIALSGAYDPSVASMSLLGVLTGLLLASLAAVVVSWWLRVRLFLVLPAASLEKLSGFAPVRRSWRSTRTNSGVIFAALLVVWLAGAAAIVLAGQVGNVLLTPSDTWGNFGGLVTLVSQLLPSVAVVLAIVAVTTAFVHPFLAVMSTVVHRFQTPRGPTG